MIWNPIDEPVDYVLIAGVRSPGIAELQGFSSPRRWDKRGGYALSGSTLVYRGVDLAEGKLLLRLSTVEHWAGWSEFSRLVQRAPLGERARSMDISHPFLEELGIRSVVVKDVLQPVETADGEWTVEIQLLEFRRPEFALATPEGSQDRPTDPYEIQIAEESAVLARELAAE